MTSVHFTRFFHPSYRAVKRHRVCDAPLFKWWMRGRYYILSGARLIARQRLANFRDNEALSIQIDFRALIAGWAQLGLIDLAEIRNDEVTSRSTSRLINIHLSLSPPFACFIEIYKITKYTKNFPGSISMFLTLKSRLSRTLTLHVRVDFNN